VLRVYRPQLKEAWKATGFVKLQKVAILGKNHGWLVVWNMNFIFP
jgi:hypothetical protein